MYHCETTSVAGFVQQLAVAYIARGYRFYVACQVPPDKDPTLVDQKLIARYGLDLSRWARARRKRRGLAGVQYLRYGHFFVLIATRGEHPFFEREPNRKDIRDHPIRFASYSIGCRAGHDGRFHASVRLHDECLRRLYRRFERLALFPDAARLAVALQALPFLSYAPVCRQLFRVLRRINQLRKTAGLELVPAAALRRQRKPVSPFAPSREKEDGAPGAE